MSDDERRHGMVTRSDFDRAFHRIEDRLSESELNVSVMLDSSKTRHDELHEILIKQGMTLEALTAMLKRHDAMLIGGEGRGGLVADTNDIKTGITIFKWVAGTGLFSSMAQLFHKISGH